MGYLHFLALNQILVIDSALMETKEIQLSHSISCLILLYQKYECMFLISKLEEKLLFNH